MSSVRINPPDFSSTKKSYEHYKQEVNAWCTITDLPKKKQAAAIALTLPSDDVSGVREKVFTELDMETLNDDNGVKTLMEYFDKLFLKDELTDTYEKYTIFDRYRRESGQKIEDYILEFERRYNQAAKKEMVLPEIVKAFKLLDASNITQQERLLVLTAVDYTKKTTLFTQAKDALKKFKGEQASVNTSGATASIKLEPAFLAENEEALYSAGFMRRPSNEPRGGLRRPFRGRYRGRGGSFTPTSKTTTTDTKTDVNHRKTNPIGPDGKPFRCHACESIRHLIRECPHSYENSVKITEHEAYVVLFTGFREEELCLFSVEATNAAVLDSACTSTVAGKQWLDTFMESMDPEDRKNITVTPSAKVFKFGAGEVKKSLGTYEIPCKMTGVKVLLSTDVVDTNIPLLLSLEAMKRAKVKIDTENDQAEVFGKIINLDITSSGHYCMPLETTEFSVEKCFFSLESMSTGEKTKKIEKIHKQFAHPTKEKFKRLIEDAGAWRDELQEIIDELYQKCQTCKVFTKTPPRPVVSVPMADGFNEVVAMDLKEWGKRYILYLIDMFSRLTVAVFINRKLPQSIADKIITMWIGVGYGVPRKILTDNGGEFSNEEIRCVAENLNIEVMCTAAYSPWQNGLCEKNHAVTDRCLEMILHDQPNMDLDVALSWAVNAKNCLKMWNGFSSYQLVFGENPNLPSIMDARPPALEGTTISETLAKHLTAMHAARRAFVQSEADEKIRRALRHKIRTSNAVYHHGDRVYYKRDGNNKWKGPGSIIGQDGKIVLIRHGGVLVRASINRVIKAGEEFEADSSKSGSMMNERCENQQSARNGAISEPETKISSEKQLNDKMVEVLGNEGQHMLESGLQLADDGSQRYDETTRRPPIKLLSTSELPKANDTIRYKINDDSQWKEAKVLGSAGKRTGGNRFWINVQNKDDEEARSINLEAVDDWEKLNDVEEHEEANVVMVPKSRHNENRVIQAKQKELNLWKEFDVYREVSDDSSLQKISTMWVITEKVVDGVLGVKARLVARGFQENDEIQSDSPTVTKSTMRIFFAIASSNAWKIKTTDIKSAFLQGKQIQREVYLEPPAEAKVPGITWKLNKVVYGLNDAARNWFMSVEENMLKLGCSQSKLDPALFFYTNEDVLRGILICHVDDFLHAGDQEFEVKVIIGMKKQFAAGTAYEDLFRYVGLNIKQHPGKITVDQNHFIERIEMIPITSNRLSQKGEPLTDEERTQYRALVGQVNWTSNQTRPDLNFEVVELSIKFKDPLVSDIARANKAVRKLQLDEHYIAFPGLGDPNSWSILLFSDAAHANLSDGVSSGGAHVIFLVGENDSCCILAWASNKIRRVVRSTIAAEALALQEGLEDAWFIKSILKELVGKEATLPIEARIDNRSVIDAIHSTKFVNDKRLRIDLAAIKQALQRKEIARLTWVPGDYMLANGLTKRGASCEKLMNILKNGNLCE